ncbi:MAG: tRNA (adenosine(37)-N6)-threonylcarbamoyltransferase complex ATPase subunit type 1 TsaE [Sandaracinaceae bacterium]|nr:tRNA (adenosine(37)-N6)-threonylcarbamoyltransferase complex ATPase subunit type 1 TsaE [Sandaracinaceae bacterium]
MHVDLQLELPNPGATQRVARALAAVLRRGDVIFLEGPLGAGKTFLAQALALALGVDADEPITSPTFTLVQEWPTALPVLHADLYRLGDAREVEGLGIRERLYDDAALVVEWGERFASELSTDGLLLELSMREGDARGARLVAKGPRGAELLNAVRHAFAETP